MPDDASDGSVTRQSALVIGLSVASFAAYRAWLGWDEEYQRRP